MTGGWRWFGGAVLAATVLLVTPADARAHVRVEEGSGPGRGGYGVVRLTVPTESPTASTVGLTVTVPADVQLASARVLPIPGWTAKVSTAGERVTGITWRAEDARRGGIGPAEFGLFTFSAGPWPADRDAVPLPVTQHYSDGTSVAWDEVALDAAAEPEHPAPVVKLGATAADHHGAAAPAAAAPHLAASVAEPGMGGPESAQWLLIGVAVVLAGVAHLRRIRG